MASFKKGDKVTFTTEGAKKYNLSPKLKDKVCTVTKVDGTTVYYNNGKNNGHVNAKYLQKVKKADKNTKNDKAAQKKNKMSAKQIENTMNNLMNASAKNEDLVKYNMRLFGIPHQFTPYCDYRTYTVKNRSRANLIGRKFIENIMLEAPVVTIIPGKPLYLPGSKNKKGVSYGFLAASNESISALTAETEAKKNKKNKKKDLKYYDFAQDYYSYMEYVNILCAVGAGFLDLDQETISDIKLSHYDWKNYRWNASRYKTATSNVINNSSKVSGSFVSSLKSMGKKLNNTIKSITNSKAINSKNKDKVKTDAFEGNKTSADVTQTLESLLTQCNFVQFYVEPTSGSSDSHSNSTSTSKLEGMFTAGSDLAKEVAFLANSGGIDAKSIQTYAKEGIDKLNEKLFENSKSALGGVMKRMLSTGSSVIKGDNIVFPEIYQSSKFTKSYSISVDLRTPYGNKLSYYLNILVPLFHLIALAIPKQSTANTYSSPFLIKAYYPGSFACNLGIVESVQIDRCPNGDGWSVDGLPTHIKVTLNITDLYSDLSMTPAGVGSIQLFLNNSSLIEYISTNCGVNLTTPQLENRAKAVTVALSQAYSKVDDDVHHAVTESLEEWISGLAGV